MVGEWGGSGIPDLGLALGPSLPVSCGLPRSGIAKRKALEPAGRCRGLVLCGSCLLPVAACLFLFRSRGSSLLFDPARGPSVVRGVKRLAEPARAVPRRSGAPRRCRHPGAAQGSLAARAQRVAADPPPAQRERDCVQARALSGWQAVEPTERLPGEHADYDRSISRRGPVACRPKAFQMG